MAKVGKITSLADYATATTSTPEVVGVNSYLLQSTVKRQQHTHYTIEIKDAYSNENELEHASYYVREYVKLDYLTESFHGMQLVRHEFSRRSCRENLWKRAVKNLYKRINFLELNISFLQEEVDEDEFEQTLMAHEDEYIITFCDVKNSLEAEAIHDIVRALGKSFDVHEVAELFGIEAKSLYSMHMKHSHRPLKLSGRGH